MLILCYCYCCYCHWCIKYWLESVSPTHCRRGTCPILTSCSLPMQLNPLIKLYVNIMYSTCYLIQKHRQMIEGDNALSLFLSNKGSYSFKKKITVPKQKCKDQESTLPFPLSCSNKKTWINPLSHWVGRKLWQWRNFWKCDKEWPRHNVKQLQPT